MWPGATSNSLPFIAYDAEYLTKDVAKSGRKTLKKHVL